MNWKQIIWGGRIETAAVPYCMFEWLQRQFIRALRNSSWLIPEQFNGFELTGPMNSYQFTQVESLLDAAFEEEARI